MQRLHMTHAIGLIVALLGASAPLTAGEAPTMFEDFQNAPEARWTYVADGVMGGVSTGGAVIDEGAVTLTGQVSTDNNGGFIQVRRRFEDGFPADTKGLRISAKGNGEKYHIFLRTKDAARVWHSYRHAFEARPEWAEISMDLAAFYPSHDGMAQRFAPSDVTGIGLVAYGADFEADVSLRSIELY